MAGGVPCTVAMDGPGGPLNSVTVLKVRYHSLIIIANVVIIVRFLIAAV